MRRLKIYPRAKCLAKLKKSIKGWNAWREANPRIVPDLSEADLSEADLSEADLSGANLGLANLIEANLSGANLSGANLFETIFVKTNLNDVQGLVACVHYGPSTIDHRTMAISGPLPLAFLRGCGLPD